MYMYTYTDQVEATNPVEKVIDMMEGMMETGKDRDT